MEKMQELTLENPLLGMYFFYSAILVLKMMLMAPLTKQQRDKHKVFINPEDAVRRNVAPTHHEAVERVRRAHRNDVENIPIFFVISFCYIMTNPEVATALLLFRTFAAVRLLHTIVYAVITIPQPARMIFWNIGFLITGYMCYASIKYFLYSFM